MCGTQWSNEIGMHTCGVCSNNCGPNMWEVDTATPLHMCCAMVECLTCSLSAPASTSPPPILRALSSFQDRPMYNVIHEGTR